MFAVNGILFNHESPRRGKSARVTDVFRPQLLSHPTSSMCKSFGSIGLIDPSVFTRVLFFCIKELCSTRILLSICPYCPCAIWKKYFFLHLGCSSNAFRHRLMLGWAGCKPGGVKTCSFPQLSQERVQANSFWGGQQPDSIHLCVQIPSPHSKPKKKKTKLSSGDLFSKQLLRIMNKSALKWKKQFLPLNLNYQLNCDESKKFYCTLLTKSAAHVIFSIRYTFSVTQRTAEKWPAGHKCPLGPSLATSGAIVTSSHSAYLFVLSRQLLLAKPLTSVGFVVRAFVGVFEITNT